MSAAAAGGKGPDVPERQPVPGLVLRGWLDPSVVALAVVALAAGWGQFGAVAGLGDVARSFGHIGHGATVADQAGLSGTELGVGLAVIRLASLGALPVAGAADRVGRRRVLLGASVFGLVLTVAAAVSPSYWWFVAVFAAGRPALSAAASVSQVAAAEETAAADRARAVALIAGAYGVGSGATVVIHGLGSGALGFRWLFALAVVPLVLVVGVRHRLVETSRFAVAAAVPDQPLPVLGPVGRSYRGRLAVVVALAFAVAVATGPANSFVFLYAQTVRHLAGWVTVLMVVAAGAAGLAGLVGGRWLADRVGRRPTGAFAVVLMAVAATVAYSGTRLALVGGYVAGVACGSLLAPAAGSLANELFPTGVRASVAGWVVAGGVVGATAGLLLFGALADVGGGFGVAGVVTFLPVAPAAGLFFLVPETRGREPESLAPAAGR